MQELDFSKFSQDALSAIELAAKLSVDGMGSNSVGYVALMVAAVNVGGREVLACVRQHGYDVDSTMQSLSQCFSAGRSISGVAKFDNELENLFCGMYMSYNRITLLMLVDQMLNYPTATLKRHLVQENSAGSMQTSRSQSNSPRIVDDEIGETIREYCTNMLKQAAEGKIHHAVGRDDEVERVLLILARGTKNNPVLVGEAGTGKTAIVEELAIRLMERTVPPVLSELKLYSLDFPLIKTTPDPLGVMRSIVKEASSDPNIVLFIDEIHMIIGSGCSSNTDIANMMKPPMARGEIKIIGATTIDEYKIIEKDSAFERRFQKVIVDEPDIESAIKIIEGSRERFENHHSVIIPVDVCKAAVSLSARYIPSRKLPDKAFDLIDEAAAKLRVEGYGRRRLETGDLKKVVTDWTGIPVSDLGDDEVQNLQNLEETLHKSVVGQDRAIKAVANAIKRSRMGFADPTKPTGSFLFLGTTGTGKTELCKALAKFLFHDPDMMVRIDMSEYQQEHSVSRLFGAPPGYVGYEQGGQLTEAVRRKPFSIVLLDEIEKAHPKVFETLLQVLDDGRMTDGQGKVIDFKNTIVVMTSNIGQSHILRTLTGQSVNDGLVEDCTNEVMRQLKQKVAPEFINRIDKIVMFLPLSKSDVAEIAKINLAKEEKKLAERGIIIRIAPVVIDFIVMKGYEPEYGGRPVKRAITEYIVNPLTSAIIDNKISVKRPIMITVYNNIIHFTNDTIA